MLDEFEEDIPHLNDLRPRLRGLIADPNKNLDAISMDIVEHILEHRALDVDSPGYDEARSEAQCLAIDAVISIISDLDVNEVNFRRIRDWIPRWNDYNAYERTLTDFAHFLSRDERKKIIAAGKKIFDKDLTLGWD